MKKYGSKLKFQSVFLIKELPTNELPTNELPTNKMEFESSTQSLGSKINELPVRK